MALLRASWLRPRPPSPTPSPRRDPPGTAAPRTDARSKQLPGGRSFVGDRRAEESGRGGVRSGRGLSSHLAAGSPGRSAGPSGVIMPPRQEGVRIRTPGTETGVKRPAGTATARVARLAPFVRGPCAATGVRGGLGRRRDGHQ